MTQTIVYIVSAVLSVLVMVGIAMMSKPRSAKAGNLLSALAMLLGIIFTLTNVHGVNGPIISVWTLYPSLLVGIILGAVMAARVKMIEMPQMVALFNGLGGGASALVGILAVIQLGVPVVENAPVPGEQLRIFNSVTGYLAICVGMITLVGSLVAAGKLHRLISQKPQVWCCHSLVTAISLFITFIFIVVGSLPGVHSSGQDIWMVWGVLLFSSIFGLYFSIRVGGADMPITISLLNSLSGVAGAIAGMAIGDVLLVAVGGIVGASGLLLTQIMCKAMNRSLLSILFARAPKVAATAEKSVPPPIPFKEQPAPSKPATQTRQDVLAAAKRVIIVPGYGMALAQAQHQVKQLADALTAKGVEVKYAIHPVAGRMPGHMNVLLAEANVAYDELFQMEDINDDFAKADLTIVIGANDVLNPAARDAEGTPIYGMPVLNVDKCAYTIICNYDLKPGYAGVENPLYSKPEGVSLLLGDAKESLATLLNELQGAKAASSTSSTQTTPDENNWEQVVAKAKRVIIVPGYGMALAQAQHQVKQLADTFTAKGAEVKYAIHPVAGRMPGHMNVLLAEANVAYDELYQMEDINEDFAKADLTIVIGANDVLNPAARNAEGTPIYGMPVLNVDQCKKVIICNYDLKPGYAGVDNPLYHNKEQVTMLLGDAKESIAKIQAALTKAADAGNQTSEQEDYKNIMAQAKRVIIVPGYGMALAQAQHQVKQLADAFIAKGVEVKYAIHPVAGRMPGHMNVLLAEANVDYEDLFQMEDINDDFAKADLTIVIGANDVLNPAARDAEGTPIYGMPVLNVDKCPYIIICNYDLKPGYAGVENPLYTREKGVTLLLGDAKESLASLLSAIR